MNEANFACCNLYEYANMSLTPYDTVGSSCAICLEDMIPFQSVLITGLCGHTFHKNCADQVQTNVDRCAKCRHVFDIELPNDCIDDNEYDNCVTIYNTRALEYFCQTRQHPSNSCMPV